MDRIPTIDDLEAELGAAGLLDIVTTACTAHGASLAEILGRKRTTRIVGARHAAMAAMRDVCSEATGLPIYGYESIARLLNRDHSAVMWGVKAHRQRVAEHAKRQAKAVA